jgi:hypothetical protein
MTAAELKAVAANGTEEEVIAAYKEAYGRDISQCKACVKQDARHYLIRMAIAMEQKSECKYRVAKLYAQTVSVGGLGALHPLTDAKVAHLQQAGLGHMVELIEVEEIGEVVTTEPVELEPVTLTEVEAEPTKATKKK